MKKLYAMHVEETEALEDRMDKIKLSATSRKAKLNTSQPCRQRNHVRGTNYHHTISTGATASQLDDASIAASITRCVVVAAMNANEYITPAVEGTPALTPILPRAYAKN